MCWTDETSHIWNEDEAVEACKWWPLNLGFSCIMEPLDMSMSLDLMHNSFTDDDSTSDD